MVEQASRGGSPDLVAKGAVSALNRASQSMHELRQRLFAEHVRTRGGDRSFYYSAAPVLIRLASGPALQQAPIEESPKHLSEEAKRERDQIRETLDTLPSKLDERLRTGLWQKLSKEKAKRIEDLITAIDKLLQNILEQWPKEPTSEELVKEKQIQAAAFQLYLQATALCRRVREGAITWETPEELEAGLPKWLEDCTPKGKPQVATKRSGLRRLIPPLGRRSARPKASHLEK